MESRGTVASLCEVMPAEVPSGPVQSSLHTSVSNHTSHGSYGVGAVLRARPQQEEGNFPENDLPMGDALDLVWSDRCLHRLPRPMVDKALSLS